MWSKVNEKKPVLIRQIRGQIVYCNIVQYLNTLTNVNVGFLSKIQSEMNLPIYPG